MGRLAARERSLAEAGELLGIEALDRSGVLVTSEGALVRYLRVAPKNPLVMSDAERAHVSHAFGQLVARVAAGQSVQFYVEAAPVRLDALLEQSRAEADRGLAPLERSGGPPGPPRSASMPTDASAGPTGNLRERGGTEASGFQALSTGSIPVARFSHRAKYELRAPARVTERVTSLAR